MARQDDEMIEFVCSQSSDDCSYHLDVISKTKMTWLEFATCLRAFAHDIESGEFRVEQAHAEKVQ